MKKRLLSVLLLMFIIVSIVPKEVFATEQITVSEETIFFEDGSSLHISIYESSTRASGTKTGYAEYLYSGSDGAAEWKAVLFGNFTYTGSTSTCTASSCNVTIYDNSWYTVSKTVGKSGNTATATVTMGLKVLGVTVSKPTYNLTLTCDKDGNLS